MGNQQASQSESPATKSESRALVPLHARSENSNGNEQGTVQDWSILMIQATQGYGLEEQGVRLEAGGLIDDDEDDVREEISSVTSTETEETSSAITTSVGSSSGNSATVPRRSKTLKVFSSADLLNPQLIGEGGFGKVLEGNLQGRQVAIKIFHAPLGVESARSQIAPLLGLKHRNLVIIKGIMATHHLSGSCGDCPQVLLDYFSEGNLLLYLSKKDNPQDYAMLGKLALDIIHGCEYLHSKNVIHGNLAARNVLIQKALSKQKTHFNAKVGDYGIFQLAKGSGPNYFTLPKTGKVVPIRWVPKELIMDDDSNTGFTYSSDVWSFGVVLWEMWTKGATPYGIHYSNVQVQEFLKRGKSPLAIHRPKGCPEHIVKVMESIFKEDPDVRPKFSKLKDDFTEFKSVSKANKNKNEAARKEQDQKNSASKIKDDQASSGSKEKEESKKKLVENGKEKETSRHQSFQASSRKQPPSSGKPKDELSSHRPSSRGDGRSNHFSSRHHRGGGHFRSANRGHNHHGSSQYSTPTPPPYTPNPLPNHLSFPDPINRPHLMMPPPPPPQQVLYGLPSMSNQQPSGSGTNAGSAIYDAEIRKRQEEIELLKAQKASDEIKQKAAELAEAIQRGAGAASSSAVSNAASVALQMAMGRGYQIQMAPPQQQQSQDSRLKHHHHSRGSGSHHGGRGRKGQSQK